MSLMKELDPSNGATRKLLFIEKKYIHFLTKTKIF